MAQWFTHLGTSIFLKKEVVGMGKTNSNEVRTAKIPVFMQDTYNADETAVLLNISVNRIYELSRRECDPLPLRCLPTQTRGYIVLRTELIEWIKRNLPPRTVQTKKNS